MNLHQSQDYKDAIIATAQHFNMRQVVIEKDYWVTYVLENLSQSDYRSKVVFKGGTSLSKAFNVIPRFSEDIDLAVISPDGYSGNQLKVLLKKISESIGVGLNPIVEHPKEKKLGKIRTTAFEYQKVMEQRDFGVVKDYILLKINCFTNPIPNIKVQIQSYISEFLVSSGNNELIQVYGLAPFEINVLSFERTFFEKVMSLNRLSYEGQKSQQEKIRHFYDIYKLFHYEQLKDNILMKDNFKIIDSVLKDDNENYTMRGAWQGQKLTQSPLFINMEDIWKELTPTYKRELSELCWSDDIPEPDEILKTFIQIKEFLSLYDTILR